MYQLTLPLGFSKLDPSGRLSLPGLTALFQDAAFLHLEEIGRGLRWQQQRDLAWMVCRWRIALLQPMPEAGERITVCTWVSSQAYALVCRGFSLKNQAGDLLAAGDSRWVLCRRPTMQIVWAKEQAAPENEPIPSLLPDDFPTRAARISRGEVLPGCFATRELLDLNGHVNNVRSLELCLRALPENLPLRGLILDYHAPLMPGAEITPLRQKTAQGWAVTLCSQEQSCVSGLFF